MRNTLRKLAYVRITFLLDGGFNLSGGDRVIAIYAQGLQKRGHQVLVVARPKRPYTLRDQLRSLRRRGRLAQKLSTYPSHFDGSPVPHQRLETFRPIADADLPDADVVISTWWETAEWAASLSPEKGAKAFFIQHYEAFEGLPKERVDAVWRLPFHKITISKWLVELAADRFGDRDVSLVFNSVDTNQFWAQPRGRQSIPTIGLLHHNLRWKGIGVSLDAIRHTLKAIPRLQLLTFGTAPFDEPLPDGVEHVHWQQPAQDFIREIYGACDVWLCGSTAEGFHLPPLEAMACRCPVVSTAVGGPMDIVTPGVNGYLAAVNDAEELGRRLVSVLNSTDAEWQRMSDAALRTALVYSWDDATKLFEAGLLRAISRSKRLSG